ncbi:MAG TPA: MBL fold metallo-hydrolase [Candidatus Binatia bacterium]|jgi:flavorubredoxin
MTMITEIAPDVFRISTYAADADLQFGQFLIRDDEPLLFHTGPRAMFPIVRDALATLVDPRTLRWIGFSHFEADESGALAEWLALAPQSQPVCSFVGALVNVNDAVDRPARPLADDEVLVTGRHRLRFLQTPHVPHCWDAGLLFDETTGTLFCSDLLTQNGDVAPTGDLATVVERHRTSVATLEAGPLAAYMPYTPHTEGVMRRLAALAPRVVATMHGSVLVGDGAAGLREAAEIMRATFGAGPR